MGELRKGRGCRGTLDEESPDHVREGGRTPDEELLDHAEGVEVQGVQAVPAEEREPCACVEGAWKSSCGCVGGRGGEGCVFPQGLPHATLSTR